MVKHKALGIILICIALFFLIVLILFKLQTTYLIDALMEESDGVCIQDGKCVHEQSSTPMYIGIAIIFVTVALGIYLLAFERSEKYTQKMHTELVNQLHETKKEQDKDEKFEFLLKALNVDEKKVMNAIKEQDGIEQATLRIRTDLSKTKLSVVLSGLAEKDLIRKVPEGKKNRVYLKNAF